MDRGCVETQSLYTQFDASIIEPAYEISETLCKNLDGRRNMNAAARRSEHVAQSKTKSTEFVSLARRNPNPYEGR